MVTLLLLFACSENELVKTDDAEGGAEPDVAPDVLVTPGAVDFGLVDLDDTASAVVTVENRGDDVLHLSDLALAGDSGDVSWTAISTPMVPAGEAVETVLTWTARAPLDDALEVASDDPDDPVVTVPLTGRVPEGDLVVEPATYDFGTLGVGDVATTVVTVSNVGAGPIRVSEWSFTANDADLAVLDAGALTNAPVLLAAGESTEVTVQYAPSAGGADESVLTVVSDDRDTPIATASQWGSGDDPCDGFSQTVTITLTADDSWRGWIDGAAFSGPNQDAWNAFDTADFELACGDHALSLYAQDTGLVIAGVIAVVEVEGTVRFVSGPTDWTMTDVSPPEGWTDPAFDDADWHIPQVCGDTSPWGSTPQPFYDRGAQWIWWDTNCRNLGEAWLRLNFTVP